MSTSLPDAKTSNFVSPHAKDIGEYVALIDPSGLTFTIACIFHSYPIGLVAGKISEESVSAGFKHAAILVIMSVVAAKLMPMFINFYMISH